MASAQVQEYQEYQERGNHDWDAWRCGTSEIKMPEVKMPAGAEEALMLDQKILAMLNQKVLKTVHPPVVHPLPPTEGVLVLEILKLKERDKALIFNQRFIRDLSRDYLCRIHTLILLLRCLQQPNIDKPLADRIFGHTLALADPIFSRCPDPQCREQFTPLMVVVMKKIFRAFQATFPQSATVLQ